MMEPGSANSHIQDKKISYGTSAILKILLPHLLIMIDSKISYKYSLFLLDKNFFIKIYQLLNYYKQKQQQKH
jgi:hypothetical protein